MSFHRRKSPAKADPTGDENMTQLLRHGVLAAWICFAISSLAIAERPLLS